MLLWGIGNELNLNAKNPKVWDAVNEISKMIHQVDPNHPTMTMLAGIGQDTANYIKTRAPDLDVLGIQMYADIVNLPRYLKEPGWTGPYIVTEWGATGHWEVRQDRTGVRRSRTTAPPRPISISSGSTPPSVRTSASASVPTCSFGAKSRNGRPPGTACSLNPARKPRRWIRCIIFGTAPGPRIAAPAWKAPGWTARRPHRTPG